MLRAVAAAGVDLGPILRCAGLNEAEAFTPEVRIPSVRAIAMLDAAIKATGDQALGLHAGERARAKDFGLANYLVVTSDTLRSAWTGLIEYSGLMSERMRGALRTEGEHAILSFKDILDPPLPSCILEGDFVVLVRSYRRLVGAEKPLLEVRFAHAQPAYVDECLRIFGAPVRFNADENAIVVPAAVLDVEIKSADRTVRPVLEDAAREALSRQHREGKTARRVRDTVHEAIQTTRSVPSLDAVALQLAVSAPTLRRRLREEGTSFNALVDDVRLSQAIQHMDNDALSLAEISYLIGFSDVSGFYQAFKRWTGETPREHLRKRRR